MTVWGKVFEAGATLAGWGQTAWQAFAGGGGGPPPGREEITWTLLTNSSSTVDGTGFTTASVSPTAGSLVIAQAVGTTAITPIIVGGGVTSWTHLNLQSGSGSRTMNVWAGIADAAGAAITFTYGASQTSCIWGVTQIDGADVSSGVTSAIITSNTHSKTDAPTAGATIAFALPNALEDATNAMFLSVAHSGNMDTNADFTIQGDAQFTPILFTDGVAAGTATLAAMAAIGETTCDPTTVSALPVWFGTAYEIKSADA